MFLLLNVCSKAIFAGFMNGLYIGRKMRYDSRKKHIHRFQYNTEEQPLETERRARNSYSIKE